MTIDYILHDMPMPIRTPRLIIMPPAAGMGQAFYDAKIESITANKEWFNWAHVETLPEIEEKTMRKQAAKFIMREDMMLMVFDHAGRLIGSSGFHWVNQSIPTVHIGYWIRQSEQGKGYVTEWVNALTRYGFDVMKFRKISINCDDANARSAAVAERLGFPLEYVSQWGIVKPEHDGQRDLRVYSRTHVEGLPPLDVSW
jgi:ribosomal-protein-serine acetyltransferase